MSSLSNKRKHKFLSIEDKLEILRRLSKGESGASLAKIYGVGTSTISDIKAKKDSLQRFASKLDSEEGSQKRKTTRTAKNSALEDAMYIWFTQRRSLGEPISGPLICEKAIQMNEKLGGPTDFKASSGWLKNFKMRHGIRELDVQGEILSADNSAAMRFKEKFVSMTIEEGYTRDDVYNADETGLNWRSLPRKSLASRREKSAPGFKIAKERVTAMVCANASGSHALDLLVIGKSKKPRCFKNIKTLPVIYRSQKNQWMDAAIFTEWYKDIFIPSVKKHRKQNKKEGKVLLIIDNAPTHPGLDVLNKIDGNIQVMFLPPNVTSILQPMDQGVIEKMKRIYRKQMLRRLLLAERDEESVLQFVKNLTLKDAIYMVADAWGSLTDDNLKHAWKKLWPIPETPNQGQDAANSETPSDANTPTDAEVVALFQTLPGFEQCDELDAREWFESDGNDPGYQHLNDEEIVDQVIEANDDGSNVRKGDDDEEMDAEEAAGPSHADAYEAFQTAMNWLERQPEGTATQLVLLKRLRDMAAKKRTSTLVQKNIKDFFTQ